MAETVGDIADSITAAAQRLEQVFTSSGWQITTPMVQIFGAHAPAYSANQLSKYFNRVAARVRTLQKTQLETNELDEYLSGIKAQVDQIQFNTINQAQSEQASSGFSLISMIDAAITQSPLPAPIPKLDWESLKDEKELLPKDLARRLRFVASSLEALEPRSLEIDRKISEIEAAHATAEQLPTDMADLATQRDELKRLKDEAVHLTGAIEAAHGQVERTTKSIEEHSKTRVRTY